MELLAALEGPAFAVGIGGPRGVNAGFVKTERGTLLVDSLVTVADGRFLAETAIAKAGPIVGLVYTHEHGDHVIGSAALPAVMGAEDAEKIEVLASEGTAAGIAEFLQRSGAELAKQGVSPKAPTLVFEAGARLLWDPEVVVVDLGGHARGSSVVYVPSAKTLFSGDLVFNGTFPWIGHADLDRWVASLEALEAWDIETVVPGHGSVGGKEILGRQRAYIERLLRVLAALKAKGASVDEARRALIEEFALTQYPEPFFQSLTMALRETFGFEERA